MKIVIVGAGEVGHNLIATLSDEGHDVTLIEQSEKLCARLDEEQNARVIKGNGSSASQLAALDVSNCDAFLAMTSDDRTNVISCSLAKGLGAKNSIARIHDATYSDASSLSYQVHFGIDLFVNPEAICAVEVAKAIRNPSRVAIEDFAKGQIEVQKVELAKGSKYINKSLSELSFGADLRIGFIKRDQSIIIPNGDCILEEGDSLTVFGHPETLFDQREKFDPTQKIESTSVVLFGGGETTISLIRMLSNPRFKIRVFEKSPEQCEILANLFPHIVVINGDATSLRLLEEEQIGVADYFVACTKDDEENILTCIQASKLGAKHVQLVINKGDYDKLLDTLKDDLNIEVVVSPRIAMTDYMKRHLATKSLTELANLPNNAGQIYQLIIPHNSPSLKKKIKEVALPKGTLIVAQLHKFNAKVPSAEDTILADDRLIVISGLDAKKIVLKKLLG